MLNSTIAANINTLSLGKQIASGSRSSLLTSHIEFTSSENKFAVAPTSYQSKCLRTTSNSKNGKMLDSDIVFNGQKKENGGVDQNKNLKVMKHHAMMNGSHESRSQGDGVPNPRICLYPQGKIHLEWRQIHKIGAGLANLGNTCFMNTVVQCLTYCPPLVNYLLHDNDHTAKCKITGFCMMCELQKHMKRALDHPGDVIKPLYIYQKLKSIAKHFQFGRQEDAHEFLRYVIDNLWKASLYNYDGNVKLDPASKETTVINHIFGGYHRSQVVCLRCREKSNTYDHFMDFILDIKQNVQNLEKALEKFVQPELLQNDNAYKCPKCNMKVSAQKRFTVHRPPNVATFQFKRFDYNRVFGGKITKHVSYPEKLDIRPYMSDTKGAAVLYRLNAVLVHLGPSCNSGHYFCYVRNSNGCWYLMDDARVHQVSLNQVLNQQAYVLFYIRVPPQSSNQLKKSMSATNHKTMDGLKNGTMVNATSDLPGTPIPRTSAVTKTTSSPAIIRVSSATSSPIVNGNVHNSSSKLSLSQNREKVVFGIRRPEPGMKNVYSKGGSTVAKATPPSTSNASGKKACLVPYDGDSSESDEGSRKPEAASSKSKTKMDTCKGENSLIKNISAEACSSAELRKQNDKVQKCDENAISVDQKATKVSSSEKQTVHRTLSPSVNTNATSANGAKVKPSFTWNVSDASLYSPSVASGSSTNSVNSTADWNVDVLAEKEANNRNKGERLYTGWTVTQNDKASNDHANKETGSSSVVPKDTCDKHIKGEDLEKKESGTEVAQSQSNASFNSKLESNCEDSAAKVGKTNGIASGRENDCSKQEMEEKSSEASTVSEQEDLKSNGKDEQSFLGKFRDHSESADSSFLKSSKKHKSSETEKRKRETNPGKGTASDNSICNVHKSSGTKRESELSSNNEAGNHPVPKKCKTTHNEYEKRKNECRHTERLSKDWKNRKKYSKHDKNSWRNHKINKRYDHRKYGLTQSHTNSSYNSQDRNYYARERSYFTEETDFVELHNNSYSDNQWNSAKKARQELKNNSSGQAQVSQYQNEDKHSSAYHSNYKTGESDNSSCSYEMEWVEKTKETVEAERKSSPDSYSAPRSWNSDIKDGFSRHRSGKNYRYDNVHWNGKNKTDAIRELQSYSSKGYGIGVNSWDGNESQLEREAQEDFLLSRVEYDLYDEEYDRGKVKKVKKWALNGRRMQPSYNPFQKAWDNRGRKYELGSIAQLFDFMTVHLAQRHQTHSRMLTTVCIDNDDNDSAATEYSAMQSFVGNWLNAKEQMYRRNKPFHRRKDFGDNNFRRWNYLKWVESKTKSARI